MTINEEVNFKGTLGKDPETFRMLSGKELVTLSLWVSVKVWSDDELFFKQAQALKKGEKVYVEGRLKTNKWKDKTTGEERESQYVTASRLEPSAAAAPELKKPTAQTKSSPDIPAKPFNPDDIDIPF